MHAACGYYQGSRCCVNPARFRRPDGAFSCGGRHNLRAMNPPRFRGMGGTRPSHAPPIVPAAEQRAFVPRSIPTSRDVTNATLPKARKNFALDILDLYHVLGKRIFTLPEWTTVLYPGVPFEGVRGAQARAWERWKQRARILGLEERGPHLSFDEFALNRNAYAWAQSQIGEEPLPKLRAPNPVRQNVPYVEEILTDRGERSMSSWRAILPLRDPVEAAVLYTLADLQQALTVRQLADYAGRGARGRGLRAPEASVRRALNALRGLGFAEISGAVGVGARQALTYSVTNTGYEAAVADKAIRAELEGESFDPAAQAEAAMAVRASRELARARSVRTGNKRTKTVVLPHDAKRPPCRLCGITHSLKAHSRHRIDGKRMRVDMLGFPVELMPEPSAPVPPAAPLEPDTSFAFGALAEANPRRHLYKCSARGCGKGAVFFARGGPYCVDHWLISAERKRAVAEAARRKPGCGCDNPPKRCLAGHHDYDPVTRACKRRGCCARADEPGQTYLLGAPPIQPMLGQQGGLFGAALPPPPPVDPYQRGLFGGNPVGSLALVGIGNPCAENPELCRSNPGALALVGIANPPGSNPVPAWALPAAIGVGAGGLAGFGYGRATCTLAHLRRAYSGAISTVREVRGAVATTRGAARAARDWFARNPGHDGMLAFVGQNPTDESQRKDRHHAGSVTLESARDYARSLGQLAEYDRALKAYVAFHGAQPTHVELYRVPSGRRRGTVEWGAGLGRVPETRYHNVPESSNKAGTYWIHKHPSGAEPLEVLIPRTGLTTKVGGSFRVTKWWYD